MKLPTPRTPLPFAELVLLLAALMSIMAFSIDSMLPAMPEITRVMSPDDATRVQLVIGAFILGAGVGQLFIGPLSDSYGRRVALLFGMTLFIVGAWGGRGADSLETLLAFRFLQGLGAAAPRTVSQAINRDLFSGRAMARVSSLTFMFFVLVPAVAPWIGQHIVAGFGWRAMFTVYMLLGAGVLAWFWLRQPETLAPEARRPFHPAKVARAMAEVLRAPVAFRYLVVMTLGFGQLIAYISAAQPIYVDALGAGDKFPLYFAFVALLSAVSGFVNARLVMRMGMRLLASVAFGSQAILALMFWGLWASGLLEMLADGAPLWGFVGWSVTLFFMNGLTFGNLNALAMEPLGHIAGTASAVLGALSSVFGVAIAMPISMAFNGTPVPLIMGVAVCSALAFGLIWTDRQRERDAPQIDT